MYALLILDVQVGLVHGPDKPWRSEELLETVNSLMDKARSAGATIFLARHTGPVGSPIEPGSPLTELAPELKLAGGEVVFEKNRPNAFTLTGLAENLRACGATGVVIRAMRAQKIDLQVLVHEDMKRAFEKYPTRWGLRRPDASIDHRRVLNLEVLMQRKGKSIPITHNPSDYRAGDWVTWRVGDDKLPHSGIVSDRQSLAGTPLIIHNIGRGTQEEDILFAFPITGHFRW